MIKLLTEKTNINGCPIEDVIKDIVGYREVSDFFVIQDVNGNVSQVEDSNIIREQLKLDSSLTVLEVGEAYVTYIENLKSQNTVSIQDRLKSVEDTITMLMGV